MKTLFLLLVIFSSNIFAMDFDDSKIESFHKMITEGKAIGLDVRSSPELLVFEANGATHIPISDLTEKAAAIEKIDKEKTILVFCEAGGRAAKAKEVLTKKGFKNVLNIKDWRNWRKIRDHKKK